MLHRLLDRVKEYRRYPQPGLMERRLLGKYTDVIDTEFTAARLASEESARYVLEHMRAVPNFDCDYDLHEWICRTQLSDDLAQGTVLEFGVATGRTLNQFARWLPDSAVHGFDSFQGLPEDWTSRMPRGFFARKRLPSVRDNCELHVGWFSDTLPRFMATNLGQRPIRLLHIDCDLYSSTHIVLTSLQRQIVPGTVIVFDEYMNYPGWQQDEFRAWQDFCGMYGRRYQYIGRVSRHQQVAVRVC